MLKLRNDLVLERSNHEALKLKFRESQHKSSSSHVPTSWSPHPKPKTLNIHSDLPPEALYL